MIVSFKNIEWAEQPTLVLKNLDGTFVQPLTNAFNIKAKLHYNETSELTFDLPAYANGEETPHCDDVVGMKIVDWIGVGQFILINPTVTNDGTSEIKECKAYSLEYELTYKNTYIAEGTYEFWNPTTRDSTVLGMILADYPSWGPGTIDDDLVGRYRTFGSDNQKTYDLMKNTLQEMYQCIFDFDTYKREINVRSVASQTLERPIYLSTDNLIKEIEIEEDTENIFTALDVNGADGVDIRSVNPLGTNTIYNLDYFMVPGNVSQKMIDGWTEWKTVYENAQQQYYNVTVEKVLEESALATAKAALTELENELSKYETLQSTYVEAAAQGIDRSAQLEEVKAKIAEQQGKIDAKKAEIVSMQEIIDASLVGQKRINNECAMENFFGEDDLKVLDRYIKKDIISEESFVYNKVDSYIEADTGTTVPNIQFRLDDAQINRTVLTSGRNVFSCVGGTVTVTVGSITVTAKVVRSALEVKNDDSKSFVYSAYLNRGTYDSVEFESAGISIAGTGAALTHDCAQVPDEGTYFSASCGESSFYFTRNCSEYQKRSVEWDLMEFGQQELADLSWPTYTFSVEVGNFLAMEDFEAFKNQFALGDKVYIDTGKSILTPIAVGVEVNFEKLSDFKLLFGDKYNLKDSAFKLVDLLEESIKMGKTTSSSRLSYSSFIDSGASTYVKEFMDSAIDAAKNAVLAGANQEIEIKESGIRLRSYDKDTETYGDEQIWMINNVIAFTDDNWSSAKMAIGKIFDQNLERYEKTTDAARDTTKTYYTDSSGTVWDPSGETQWSTALYEKTHEASAYGIAAPYIVGTLLAGASAIIESAKKDGGKAVFRVDADGAKLYNSQFDLAHDFSDGDATGLISLNPNVGLVGGKDTTSAPIFSLDTNGKMCVKTEKGNLLADASKIDTDDLPNASFWIDMLGNAYFKGTIYATDGVFSGELSAATGTFKGNLEAASGTFSGTVKAAKFEGKMDAAGSELVGPAIYVPSKEAPKFQVDKEGNVTITGGSISFDSLDSDAQQKIDNVASLAENFEWPGYIKKTYIDFNQVTTQYLNANEIRTLGTFNVGTGTPDSKGALPNEGEGAFTSIGYIGAAKGEEGLFGGTTKETSGIAMYTGESGSITAESTANYIIVTDKGVRMSCGTKASIYVSEGGAYVKQPGETTATRIGTGTGKAVFG